jgi:hypothetical protein
MAPPLPNSAHGEQLISAEPRGTARLGWMAPLRHLVCQSAGWILLIHAGEFVARLAHYMQHLDSDHIRKYAAELCRMAVFGTLNPLTPARLQA